MIKYTLKMAQIKNDSPYLPKETPQVTVDPGPPLPKSTPDQDAQDMAQQWMGQMTRIGPELYVDDSTASLLSAVKALGLPMNSKQDVMTIAGLFIDDAVLTEHIGWFNDDEWMKLIQWLQKLPSKVSHVVTLSMSALLKVAQQGSPALDLLVSLHDLKFDIDPNSQKTQMLLSLLARSGGQGAGIAQQILSMDPQSKAALFSQLETAAYGVTQTEPAKEPQAVPPAVPAAPAAPMAPAAPAPEPEQMAMNPNTPLNVSVPLPKGGRGGNKGFQYILDNFAEVTQKLAQELPEVSWAQLGADVAGIMPPSKSQGNEMSEMARGGNLVRVYDGGFTGMVLGSTEDGRLVLANAAGELISTDPESAEVRVNANGQLKPTI